MLTRRYEYPEQLLVSIIASSDDAILSKDMNGIITSWNRGAERLFGYSADEVIGKPVTILFPPELLDEEPRILERVRRGEHVDHYETTRRRKDGKSIEISLTVSPIRDSSGNIVGASKIARDISERRRSEERQHLLLREMKHRIKNTLATVQVIARQTMRSASADDRANFLSRLQALAKGHDLLTDENWERATIRAIVDASLEPFQENHRERFLVDGPDDVWLESDKSLVLGLAIHELATNAVKYGALSNESGRVSVQWELTSDERPSRIKLKWKERGGPRVQPPAHNGFGSRLIERALADQLGAAQFEFVPQGITCVVEIAL